MEEEEEEEVVVVVEEVEESWSLFPHQRRGRHL